MSNERPDPSLFKNWLETHESKKGTSEYKKVEEAYKRAARLAGFDVELRAIQQSREETIAKGGSPLKASLIGGIEGAALVASNVGPMIAEFMRSAGIRGIPTVVGEVAGERIGGKIGRRVGAAAGATVGSVADQIRQRGAEGVRAGETLADAATAAINPRNPGLAGITAAGLDVVGQAIDTGDVDLQRAAMAGTGATVGGVVANRMTPRRINPKDALMIERYKAFEEVKPYGVVINPAEIERGIPLVNQFAGVDALSNQASHRNQFAWQKMVREQSGLPMDAKDLAFTPSHRKGGKYIKGTLDEQVDKLSAPYKVIEEISKAAGEEADALAKGTLKSPKYITASVTKEGADAMIQAKKNLTALRMVRYDIKDALNKQAEGVPGAREELMRLRAAEDALEQRLEVAAIASGREGLLDELKDARQKIAVVKAIDNATTSYGLVDPKLLSVQRQSGVPLTGNLEKIALFYDAFQPSATEAVRAGPVTYTGMATNYTARNVAMGNRQGLFSGSFPVAAQSLRDYILSESQQKGFARPRVEMAPDNYISSFIRRAPALANPQPNPELPAYVPTTIAPTF